MLVKKGNTKYSIDNHEFPTKDRTLYFTNPGHLKSFDISEVAHGFLITVSEAYLKENIHEKVFDDFSFLLTEIVPPCYLDETRFSELDHLAEQILNEQKNNSILKHKIISSLFLVFLLKVKEYLLGDADFKQAYDSIDRPSLWKIMRMMSIPVKLVRLTQVCCEGSSCCVRVGGGRTNTFAVTSGLKQGCPLASSLFNLVLEWVMRQVERGAGLELGPARCDRLAYADDADLMAETFAEVSEKVRSFKAAAEKVGLRINEAKTKLMMVGRGQELVGEHVPCGGLRVEAVGSFKYLGSVITNRNDIDLEIAARIASG